ncbi:MAG: zf-HC2 domain-containing protein [Chloroflexi bacterium]|nr:zf-HC2 domain-containing protein [Chloroflexota bacterium]MDA1272235.1 zf-HC2 domain-containing protein [Chloroflexota bacterium]
MGHDESAGLVAGYVLSALDVDELKEFEAHLKTCPECQVVVAEMRPVVDALSLANDENEPSNALRERILGSARAEPRQWQSSGARQPNHQAPWWRRPVLWPMPIAAVITALAVAVAVLAVWGSRADDGLSSTERRLALTYDGMEIMAQADQWWRFSGSTATPGVAGTLAYSQELGVACLLVWGLTEGDESIYQVRLTESDGQIQQRKMWRYDNAMWLIIEADPNQLGKLEVVVGAGDSGSPAESPAVINVPLTPS